MGDLKFDNSFWNDVNGSDSKDNLNIELNLNENNLVKPVNRPLDYKNNPKYLNQFLTSNINNNNPQNNNVDKEDEVNELDKQKKKRK